MVFILTFDSLLRKNFYHMYQPLFYVHDWSIFGYEGFFRSEVNSNPESIFRLAKENGRLYELDTQSIFKALLAFSKNNVQVGKLIFANVFPSTLTDPLFFYFIDQLLSQITIPSQRIVLEIKESEKIEDMKLFRQIILQLKDYGFLIAIDNIGKSDSQFKRAVELEPMFVKLDRQFSMNLASSPEKQRFISVVNDYCDRGTKLILEGIEKPVDLATAKLLGIPIVQGFLLGKPSLLSEVNNS